MRTPCPEISLRIPFLLILAAVVFTGCGSDAPEPGEEAPVAGQGERAPSGPTESAPAQPPAPAGGAGAPPRPPAGTQPPPPGGSGNPLDDYIEQAAAFLASTQADDGSWEYFHSTTPDFSESEAHANLFGTIITLMNLTHTGYERSDLFDRGARFVRGRMLEGNVWSLYEPGYFKSDSWFEPDADDSAVALVLLADRLNLTREESSELRALFDRHRTTEGLYRTYFDGFHGDKGFVPDPNPPSLGVNLNVLAFFGKYELERSRLVAAIDAMTREELYWERTPFYRSLAIIAYLASNALEHGADEVEPLLGRFLDDLNVGSGQDQTPPGRLNNLHLAAYVKARSHYCLVTAQPCRELDQAVMVLARRRVKDGSWSPGPFYEYDVNQDSLVAFLERRDFAVARSRGGVSYDVDRALAAPGTTRYYDGSRGETTSFAVKALVFYRELIRRRQVFAHAPKAE